MKTRALVMAGLIATTIMASTRVAQAQEQIVVKVPFEFVAGNKTLPAGEYAVKITGPTHVLVLVDRRNSTASPFLNTNDVVTTDIQPESKLVFNRYGDHYFLAQVWSAGNSRGRRLMKSSREKEIALTAKIETEGLVTLVASLPLN
jgi:hypothetical protein